MNRQATVPTIDQRQKLERLLAKDRVQRSARREKHGNVIEWRSESLERRMRRLGLPAAPGSWQHPEIIHPRRQNVWLGVLVIVAFLIAAGAMAGAL